MRISDWSSDVCSSDLRFPQLPEWLQNFGVLANYTYIDHGTELPEALAETLPGQQRIAGVSNHIANASVFYENQSFSARLSDRKSTRLNSSTSCASRMPSSS